MLPHLWKAALVTGIAALAFGALVFLWPGVTILVAAIFFGAYLLVTGIFQLVMAFSLRASLGGRVLLFLGGAAALVLAVLCFINLQNSIDLLAIWIGIGFVFRGVATLMSAIGDNTLPGRVWEIVVGALGIVAGIIMFAAPLEGLVAVTQVTGIILVVLGVVEIVTALRIRRESNTTPRSGAEPVVS